MWPAQLEDAVARARQVEGQLLNARKGDDELLHENRCLSSKLATVTFQVFCLPLLPLSLALAQTLHKDELSARPRFSSLARTGPAK